jgi:hypothetical protein
MYILGAVCLPRGQEASPGACKSFMEQREEPHICSVVDSKPVVTVRIRNYCTGSGSRSDLFDKKICIFLCKFFFKMVQFVLDCTHNPLENLQSFLKSLFTDPLCANYLICLVKNGGMTLKVGSGSRV